VLELIDLHRRYGDTVALDGVTFSVPPGRIVGFVGRNGSGKTTTMRAILGLVRPDQGVVRWRGAAITAADRLRIGYLPEERGLYPRMRVTHQLVFLARLSGVDPATAHERAIRWLDRLGLADRADDRLEELSLGNQQRVQLAAALVHEPELAILDEPFSGLDPVGVDVMSETLLAEAAAGRGVLFSSHQLELVERLCDDVVVIEAGRIVADEPVGAHRPAESGVVSLADRFRQLVPR
jgi:ABC-2 type transport system ATP-binding protein